MFTRTSVEKIMEDLYAILRVAPTASDEEIKASFRRLALLFHPDKNPAADAKELFQSLGNAWEILKDPIHRATYDRNYNAEISRQLQAGMNSAKGQTEMRMPEQYGQENMAQERARYAAEAERLRREQVEQLARAKAREEAERAKAKARHDAHLARAQAQAAAEEAQRVARAAAEALERKERKERNWRNSANLPPKIAMWMKDTREEYINKVNQHYPEQIAILTSIRAKEGEAKFLLLQIQWLNTEIGKRLWELNGYPRSASRLRNAADDLAELSMEHDNTYNDLQRQRTSLLQQLDEVKKKIAEEECGRVQLKEQVDWADQIDRINRAGEAVRFLERMMREMPSKLDHMETLERCYHDWQLVARVSVNSSLHTPREKQILMHYTRWLETENCQLHLDFYMVIFRSLND